MNPFTYGFPPAFRDLLLQGYTITFKPLLPVYSGILLGVSKDDFKCHVHISVEDLHEPEKLGIMILNIHEMLPRKPQKPHIP